MFPDFRKLNDSLRAIVVTDEDEGSRHQLRFHEVMRSCDIVVLLVGCEGDFFKSSQAVRFNGDTIDVCVANRHGRVCWSTLPNAKGEKEG